jgi:hypothetical protein
MSEKHSVDRRDFLKTAAVTGAAALSAGSAAAAAQAPQGTPPTQASAPVAPREVDPGGNVEVLTTDRPGGDFMVDVIKTLDFEFIASNPGSSFRGIHESIINYGNNTKPEFIYLLPRGIRRRDGARLLQGRGPADGGAVPRHRRHAARGDGDLQRLLRSRAGLRPRRQLARRTLRRPGVEWAHSVQDAAAMVRDFIKWDDQPISLPHFAESAMRAYKIAMTPPMMPVLLVIDGGPAERSESRTRSALACAFRDSRWRHRRRAIRARLPKPRGCWSTRRTRVIVADRAARTPSGITHLIALAEALQAPVVSQGGRMNFPSRHPLNQTSNSRQLIADADVILGLEFDRLLGYGRPLCADGLTRDVAIAGQAGHNSSASPHSISLPGQLSGFPALSRGDVAMAADAEATLPGTARGVQSRDVHRSPQRLRGSREAAGDGACVRARTGARRGRLRVGRVADQHRAHDDGTMGAD